MQGQEYAKPTTGYWFRTDYRIVLKNDPLIVIDNSLCVMINQSN